MNSGRAPRDLYERLDELIVAGAQVDLRVPQESQITHLARELAPRVAELLERGIDLLSAVIASYDPEEERGDPMSASDESLADIGLLISSEMAGREVADLAHLARGELQELRHELASAATRPEPVAIASACETGSRRLRRTLISIESAIYEYDGREPPLRLLADLNVSLQTRQLYGELRREITQRQPNAARDLTRTLHAVAARLITLRELSIYSFLRFDDRVQLRKLLQRILDWLRVVPRDLEGGRRLWQDLTAFAELLVQVNHRQELRQHDRQVVDRAYRVLCQGESTEWKQEEALAEIRSLRGLDDELDELLLGGEVPIEAWRNPLARLRARLVVHPGASGFAPAIGS